MHHLTGASWPSDLFQTWAPDLFTEYKACHDDYCRRRPDLRTLFHTLPFAAVTANFGPQTVCDPHRDSQDLVWGWCVVWTLGTYDFEMGGHLVLHEAKLILEYAPGDIIFMPSGCILHENIPIQPGEERYSLTFYSAGQLFQYRDCGWRTVKKLPAGERAEHDAKGSERWEKGCNRFSTLEELKAKHGVTADVSGFASE